MTFKSKNKIYVITLWWESKEYEIMMFGVIRLKLKPGIYLSVSLNGLGSTQTNADAWSMLQSPNAAQSLHSSIAGVWYATCCTPHRGTAWHSTFAGWNRTSSWTSLPTWLPQSTCLLCLGPCVVKRYKVCGKKVMMLIVSLHSAPKIDGKLKKPLLWRILGQSLCQMRNWMFS